MGCDWFVVPTKVVISCPAATNVPFGSFQGQRRPSPISPSSHSSRQNARSSRPPDSFRPALRRDRSACAIPPLTPLFHRPHHSPRRKSRPKRRILAQVGREKSELRGCLQSRLPAQHLSQSRRNLAAREFHPVMRIKHLDFGAKASWEQFVRSDTQGCCHYEKLKIGNATILGFHSSDGFAANVPAKHLKPHRKLILCPPYSLAEFADLRPNDIQFGGVFSDAIHRIKTIPALCELHCTFYPCTWAADLQNDRK
jgi:hypothetical protein